MFRHLRPPAGAERALPELSRDVDGWSLPRRHSSQFGISRMKCVVMNHQERLEELEAIAARGRLFQMGAHGFRVHSKRRQDIGNMRGARVGAHADPILQIASTMQLRVEQSEPLEDAPVQEDRGRLPQQVLGDSSQCRLAYFLCGPLVRVSICGFDLCLVIKVEVSSLLSRPWFENEVTGT